MEGRGLLFTGNGRHNESERGVKRERERESGEIKRERKNVKGREKQVERGRDR